MNIVCSGHTRLNTSTINVMVDSPSNKQKPARRKKLTKGTAATHWLLNKVSGWSISRLGSQNTMPYIFWSKLSRDFASWGLRDSASVRISPKLWSWGRIHKTHLSATFSLKYGKLPLKLRVSLMFQGLHLSIKGFTYLLKNSLKFLRFKGKP